MGKQNQKLWDQKTMTNGPWLDQHTRCMKTNKKGQRWSKFCLFSIATRCLSFECEKKGEKGRKKGLKKERKKTNIRDAFHKNVYCVTKRPGYLVFMEWSIIIISRSVTSCTWNQVIMVYLLSKMLQKWRKNYKSEYEDTQNSDPRCRSARWTHGKDIVQKRMLLIIS